MLLIVMGLVLSLCCLGFVGSSVTVVLDVMGFGRLVIGCCFPVRGNTYNNQVDSLHVAEAFTLVALHLRISWKRFSWKLFADENFAAILSN